MAQMYIIYINETPIFIGLNEKNSIKNPFIVVNEDNIFLEVQKKIQNNDNIPLYWQTDNPKKVLELLPNYFKYIEAAGGVVCNQSAEYLFIYRLCKWDLPKGKIEKGELITECAIREVEEECGILVDNIFSELPDTFHIYEHKGRIVLKKTYWFMMAYSGSGDLIPQTEEHIDKAVWITKDSLHQVLSNTYPSIRDIIEILEKNK
jgi:ADP-ribose pyrophosphatase YjhB (NUDIX family)